MAGVERLHFLCVCVLLMYHFFCHSWSIALLRNLIFWDMCITKWRIFVKGYLNLQVRLSAQVTRIKLICSYIHLSQHQISEVWSTKAFFVAALYDKAFVTSPVTITASAFEVQTFWRAECTSSLLTSLGTRNSAVRTYGNESKWTSRHSAKHCVVGRVFLCLIPNSRVASVLMRATLFSVSGKVYCLYVAGRALLPCLYICRCKTWSTATQNLKFGGIPGNT